MRIYIGIIILSLILLAACQSQEQKVNLSINGTWESIGSGWIMEITDSANYALYDITAISCLPNWKGSFAEIQASIQLNKDTISYFEETMRHEFVRGEKLPEICTQILREAKANDPLYNFEVFAETVKEHYAFFELNKINWNELYIQQKAKLNKQSTAAELYLLIDETLEKLNDNHAFLEATDEVHDVVDKILAEATFDEEQSDEKGLPEYGDFQVAAMVAEHHLQEEMTEDSWLIQWGKLTNDIGYVQIKAMWLYADLDIPKQLREELGFVDAYVETFHKMYDGDYVKKELQGVSKILDKVMQDLAQMESIVLDVRFNGGGQDAVSNEILSRFVPTTTAAARQNIRYGKKHTRPVPIYIQGTKKAYTKPVYILTSRQTGSAAECFSLAAMSMNHIKRIGARTAGALSTALEKTLPNGWNFAISNQIYMDNQGVAYENIGAPVSYRLNYSEDRQDFFRSVANDLEKDKRDILRAIEELEGE